MSPDSNSRTALPIPDRAYWVQFDVDAAAADTDHLITPKERIRVAMARQ